MPTVAMRSWAAAPTCFRGDVVLGMVWTLRTTAPFSARAGVDLNGDGANTDYVPGTHKGQGNRDLDVNLVNAWRATRGLGPVNEANFSQNDFKRFDLRVSKAFAMGGKRRLEGIFRDLQPVRSRQPRRHRQQLPDQRAVGHVRTVDHRSAQAAERESRCVSRSRSLLGKGKGGRGKGPPSPFPFPLPP